MVTNRAFCIFTFLRSSVTSGDESIAAARGFVRGLEGLTAEERHFLCVALRDNEGMERFYGILSDLAVGPEKAAGHA